MEDSGDDARLDEDQRMVLAEALGLDVTDDAEMKEAEGVTLGLIDSVGEINSVGGGTLMAELQEIHDNGTKTEMYNHIARTVAKDEETGMGFAFDKIMVAFVLFMDHEDSEYDWLALRKDGVLRDMLVERMRMLDLTNVFRPMAGIVKKTLMLDEEGNELADILAFAGIMKEMIEFMIDMTGISTLLKKVTLAEAIAVHDQLAEGHVGIDEQLVYSDKCAECIVANGATFGPVEGAVDQLNIRVWCVGESSFAAVKDGEQWRIMPGTRHKQITRFIAEVFIARKKKNKGSGGRHRLKIEKLTIGQRNDLAILRDKAYDGYMRLVLYYNELGKEFKIEDGAEVIYGYRQQRDNNKMIYGAEERRDYNKMMSRILPHADYFEDRVRECWGMTVRLAEYVRVTNEGFKPRMDRYDRFGLFCDMLSLGVDGRLVEYMDSGLRARALIDGANEINGCGNKAKIVINLSPGAEGGSRQKVNRRTREMYMNRKNDEKMIGQYFIDEKNSCADGFVRNLNAEIYKFPTTHMHNGCIVLSTVVLKMPKITMATIDGANKMRNCFYRGQEEEAYVAKTQSVKRKLFYGETTE